MAILTIDQFAEKCNMPRKNLMTYVGRQKVKVDGETVDTTDPLNIAFYNNREATGKLVPKNDAAPPPVKPKPGKKEAPVKIEPAPVQQVPREKTFVAPKDFTLRPASGEDDFPDDDDEDDDDDILELPDSQKHLKHWQAKKARQETTLLNLKTEKLRGEVIPTEPIEQLIFQFKQYMLTQAKITYQKFLNEVSHKYEITPEDMAYYRGFFIKELNNSASEASDNFVRDLDVIINVFAVKKGAGERG